LMERPVRAMCAALSLFCLAASAGAAQASDAPTVPRPGAAAATPTDVSSQTRSRQHAPRRVHIYGRSRGPGPNSVRICNAHYEQEFRLSGTVIVPKMHCYWSG
jgi:hypothetical protein